MKPILWLLGEDVAVPAGSHAAAAAAGGSRAAMSTAAQDSRRMPTAMKLSGIGLLQYLLRVMSASAAARQATELLVSRENMQVIMRVFSLAAADSDAGVRALALQALAEAFGVLGRTAGGAANEQAALAPPAFSTSLYEPSPVGSSQGARSGDCRAGHAAAAGCDTDAGEDVSGDDDDDDDDDDVCSGGGDGNVGCGGDAAMSGLRQSSDGEYINYLDSAVAVPCCADSNRHPRCIVACE
jgi:hypothetical protein